MSFRPITNDDLKTYRGKFITIYKPIAGHKAEMYWWNRDDGGFWEPWTVSDCAFATEKEAYQSAKEWAEAEDCPYIERKDLE